MSAPGPEYLPSQGATAGQHYAGPQHYYGSADDTAMYTRAPPAYGDDEALLRGGAPRSSEDNIPDDFKYGGVVSEASIDIRHAFVRKVYAILTVQLIATAVVSAISFFSDGFKMWIQSNNWMVFLSLFGALGFLFATYWKRKSYPTNLLFLAGFTLLEAYSVAVITSFYDSRIVLEATVITGALFIALTLFACQTKYDITSWYSYLYGALWLLIIFGFVGMFFPGGKMELIYSGLAALLFSAYIMVDTQLIMRHLHVEEEIAAAISLYLDIINLFLAILRILNSSSDN
jgi:hypothetical protein